MNTIISEAILAKRLIQFTYVDAKGNIHLRIFEPYAYGINKEGKEAVRCYQTGHVSGQIFHTLTLRPGQLGTLTVHTTVGCSGLPIAVTPGFTGSPQVSV